MTNALTNQIYAGDVSVAVCPICGNTYTRVAGLKRFTADESVFELECESVLNQSPVAHEVGSELVVRNYKGELQVFTRSVR